MNVLKALASIIPIYLDVIFLSNNTQRYYTCLTKGMFSPFNVQGGSNMTGTDLCVKKPHCAAAVRP
jgi:hypothetical protein